MAAERRPRGGYARALEWFGRTPVGDFFTKRVAPNVDPPLLHLSGGRFSSVYPIPVMMLTTIGAKSGLRRELPLAYAVDGDSLILIASNYGRPGHPAWYRNLIANPRVEVLAGKFSGTYTASEIVDAAERSAAWEQAVDVYAGYDDYVVRAGDRTIPVVRLTRT
ncbi:nitroreductase/quinone reductase family protein [Mycobacterium sp. 236(2023)]|uniref:nitroreductase/quinone reductase family protein n=1 Tax=Mycobacterium sp. 236(2023) TaxID=3038163 RepID=UPI0024155009|nr:nitroreductase/quinone reductase family protein [Mycobacterium sp. 236(2023)]MDG4668313.1 nitroreductase/quinone reductase family protein [Mycobacterium sp. 236(2023)]